MSDPEEVLLALKRCAAWGTLQKRIRGLRLGWSAKDDAINARDARHFCSCAGSIIFCSLALRALPRYAQAGILLHEMVHLGFRLDGSPVGENLVDAVCQALFRKYLGYTYTDVGYRDAAGRYRVARNLEVCMHPPPIARRRGE